MTHLKQGDKQKKVGIYEKLGIKQIFGMKVIKTKYNPNWEIEEKIYKKMLKNFGKENYMDKQSNKCDCRNCYIKGFTDCMNKLKILLNQ